LARVQHIAHGEKILIVEDHEDVRA